MRIMSPWSGSTVFAPLRARKAALIFLLLLGLGLSAQAQSPARRFVNAKAAPGGDGLSWATAFSTIQPAVDAVASAGGEVWVAEGTYVSTNTQVVNIPATVKLYGGFAGTESTLTGRNPATHQTVIDGQQTRQGVRNSGLLDGFIVQNGRSANVFAQDTSNGYNGGGGVYNRGTVTGCTVTGCFAYYQGGGIYNDAGTVTDCTVTSNLVSDYYDGFLVRLDAHGGGIANLSGTVKNCIVMGNSAEAFHYGGICEGGGVDNASGTVTGCTVMDNSADDSGGGIDNFSGTVTGCTVRDNSSRVGNGGGVRNYYGTVSGCKVAGNSTFKDGGGIYIYSGTVTGCTVVSNSASNNGGGMSISYNSTVTGCTVVGNSAANDGGGMNNDSDTTVTGCIVWRNHATDISGYLAGVTYSCFGEASSSNHNNLRANPHFVSMAGNDPLAWDLRLSPDSPCIDAGTTAAPSLPSTDILGNARPGGDGLVDMGAYESPDAYTPGTPAPPLVLYVSPQGNGTTGKDWTTAFNSITSATQVAQAGSDLYEIRVARGTYHESHELVLPGRASLVGGWSGNASQPAERNVTEFKTVIDGEKKYRCLTNHGLLDGLWIQNGLASDGGGVLNYGTVIGCTVTSSSASSGGGIANNFGMVTGCTITSCSASNGSGGITNYYGTVTDCIVTGNSGKGNGGGVYNGYASRVANCLVANNVVSGCGGGIYNYYTCTVTNCTVTGNSANGSYGDGGGIYNYSVVLNCIVAGNFANRNGGGIYNDYSTTVTNCTVTGNSANGSGGGIYIEKGPITNCIVWRNSKSDIVGDSGSNVTYSCFGEATNSNHNLHADPLFVLTLGSDPQAWNLRLQVNSPCIGTGTTEAKGLPATDIEGNPRPGNDGLVDMGAYEESSNSRIIRYLLGQDTDPTGLDANGDGKVDVADVVSHTNAIPPAMPTAPIPSDQATVVSLTPRFRWAAAPYAAVPYARSYDLYLWKAAETTPTTPVVSGLPIPASDAPATLSYATAYKWRVAAHNVTAQTAGPVWQFTTRPYPVRVVSPNGGETWTRGTNVQVRYLADVRNSGTSYRIELWRGNTKAATLKAAVSNTVGDKTETIPLPATLTAANDYKVRVTSIYMESHNGGPDAWDASDQPFTIK